MSGPIPPELGNLSRLVYLNLGRNGTGGESRGISGPIPGELGELGELVALTLQGNSLTGSVPGELGRLAKLRVLSLTHNPLEGPLPAALTGLRSLETFAAGADRAVRAHRHPLHPLVGGHPQSAGSFLRRRR